MSEDLARENAELRRQLATLGIAMTEAVADIRVWMPCPNACICCASAMRVRTKKIDSALAARRAETKGETT